MAERRRREGIWERTVQALDIPAEVAGVPRVELVGRHQLRVENHRGILAYGREEILVSGGAGLLLRVRGTELELQVMTGQELLIAGTVLSVELE